MPSLVQSYDVLLDLINDMQDSVSVQLLRDYGRNGGAVVLLSPTESVTLILESGSPYRYAIKSRNRVANVTARSWRDIQCSISGLFHEGARSNSNPGTASDPSQQPQAQEPPVNGVSVDRLWRDHRICRYLSWAQRGPIVEHIYRHSIFVVPQYGGPATAKLKDRTSFEQGGAWTDKHPHLTGTSLDRALIGVEEQRGGRIWEVDLVAGSTLDIRQKPLTLAHRGRE